MKRAIPLFALLVAACIDFREGLQCRNDDDCHGLVCEARVCVVLDGGLVRPGGGQGGGGSTLGGLSLISATPKGDDNGDGELSPGESAGLVLLLLNNGNTTVANLTGTLSTTRTGVTLTGAAGLRFGDLGSGRTACGTSPTSAQPQAVCYGGKADYPVVTIATSIAPGTSIPFTLALRDGAGRTADLSVAYVTPRIDQTLVVVSSTVVGDNSGNGELGSGENAGLKILLVNSGTSRATGLIATLSTTTSGVTVSNGAGLRFGDITSNGNGCGVVPASGLAPGICYGLKADYPTVTASAGIATGTRADFALAVRDAYGNAINLTFSLTIR